VSDRESCPITYSVFRCRWIACQVARSPIAVGGHRVVRLLLETERNGL
jgi:hypothetical protein